MAAFCLHLLNVHREINVCYAAVTERGTAGKIRRWLDMAWPHDPHTVGSDIREDSIQINVLLGMGADEIVIMMAGDGENRLPIQFGVVQPIEQVQTTGARRGEADAQPTRE